MSRQQFVTARDTAGGRMDKRHAELAGSHELDWVRQGGTPKQDKVCLVATPELECVRWDATPALDSVRLGGTPEQDKVRRVATPEQECVRWGITPEQELVRRGFRILEKPLSVGAARILARVDLLARTVCLDMEAVGAYAQEQGLSVEQMRQQALAHELGHVLNPHLRGRAAEQAAQACVDQWLKESRGGE